MMDQPTGRLTEDRHECISPVIHRWVVAIQDRMPAEMMAPGDEHGGRWRAALPLVAGTAGDGRDEWRRRQILGWMWRCLSAPDGCDLDVPEWVPGSACEAWAVMLRERTVAAAYAAASAASAAADAYAAAADAYAAVADAYAAAAYAAYDDDDDAYAASARTLLSGAAHGVACDVAWRRRDPAALLHALIKGDTR